MKSSLVGAAAAVLLAVSLAPMALAADDRATPSDQPTPAVEPTPTPVENGEIVIDPTFFAPTSEPQGQVAAATARPEVTPPATDSPAPTTTPGTSLQVLLCLVAAGSLLVLAIVPHPARRRS